MPVLINDLEVEVQQPTAESTADSSQRAENAAQNTISPSDMSLILEQQIERQERIRSH